MKLFILCLKTTAAFAAYIISFILFQYSNLFHELLEKTKSGIGTITVINLIAAILTGMVYISTRNTFPFVRSMCVALSIPAVLSHSKLLGRILPWGFESYLSIGVTSLLFFIMIMLLLTAGKLENCEDEVETLLENGTSEEDIIIILKSRLKFYLFYCAITTALYILISLLGFVVLDMKGPGQSIIITATLGILLFIVLIIFVYKKWQSQADI